MNPSGKLLYYCYTHLQRCNGREAQGWGAALCYKGPQIQPLSVQIPNWSEVLFKDTSALWVPCTDLSSMAANRLTCSLNSTICVRHINVKISWLLGLNQPIALRAGFISCHQLKIFMFMWTFPLMFSRLVLTKARIGKPKRNCYSWLMLPLNIADSSNRMFIS